MEGYVGQGHHFLHVLPLNNRGDDNTNECRKCQMDKKTIKNDILFKVLWLLQCFNNQGFINPKNFEKKI